MWSCRVTHKSRSNPEADSALPSWYASNALLYSPTSSIALPRTKYMVLRVSTGSFFAGNRPRSISAASLGELSWMSDFAYTIVIVRSSFPLRTSGSTSFRAFCGSFIRSHVFAFPAITPWWDGCNFNALSYAAMACSNSPCVVSMSASNPW